MYMYNAVHMHACTCICSIHRIQCISRLYYVMYMYIYTYMYIYSVVKAVD